MTGLVMLAVYIVAAIIVFIAGSMLVVIALALVSFLIEAFFRIILALAGAVHWLFAGTLSIITRLVTHLVTLARKVVTNARR